MTLFAEPFKGEKYEITQDSTTDFNQPSHKTTMATHQTSNAASTDTASDSRAEGGENDNSQDR